MVALADWYILPILFQLEKLSRPSRWVLLRLGRPKFIHRILQAVYSTKVYGVENTAHLGEWSINLYYIIGWIFNLPANDQIPCGWTGQLYQDLYYGIHACSYFWGIFKEILFNQSSEAASVVLSTWSLLCGGQHQVDAVIPFLTQWWGFMSIGTGSLRFSA